MKNAKTTKHKNARKYKDGQKSEMKEKIRSKEQE